jgi:ribosomal protein L11 methyltransferase
MSWVELKIRIQESILEKISAYLFAMGCEGMNVQKNYVIVYFSQHRWTNEIKSAIFQYINHFMPLFSEKFVRIKTIKNKDWDQIWRSSFKQLRLTYKIIIKPPWDKYKGLAGETVVTIDPKMAFGTGHHESTQLIIENMEKLIHSETSVLDIGTGSGILAILAEKLGAEKIMAIDNDMIAVKNARENIITNKCKNIKLFASTLEFMEPEEFDLILANMNRNVLLQYASYFSLFMKINAKIFLSGILLADEIILTDTFQKNGFKTVKKYAKKEWLSIIFELIEKKQKEQTNESI